MKKIQIAKPFIDDNDKKAVMDVLDSGWLSLGPKYKEFENNMCSYTGAKYASVVSSGTAGLHLAVKATNLGASDEVITSPFSFIASSNCLLYEKVKPVFVDIEEDTYNMDPRFIEAAITSKTKAILVVHIFGQSADMSAIQKIAKKYKLKIIEDACESLGATYKGKMTGTFGDAGVYAFYPNKQMTTGEGGILVTNSKKVKDVCDSLKNQGRNTKNDWLQHVQIGYNYRMDEMSAALGVTQLKKLDWMIEQKRKIAEWYTQALATVPSVITPTIGKQRTHSWFVYVVRIPGRKRDMIMARLAGQGIQTKSYLPVIHLQPFMKKLYGYKKGAFPVAERVASQTLALPFYIGLTQKDIKYIVDAIKQSL
jgi:perosamine synthetase